MESLIRSASPRCPRGTVWRSGHYRKTRSGKSIRVPGKCVKQRGYKSPMQSAMARLSRSGGRKCSPGFAWRKAYTRVSKSGKVSRVKGGCVKSRSGKSKSPRMRYMSPSRCPPGTVWRSPHKRRSKSGKVFSVKGNCVKPSRGRPAIVARSPSPEVECPPGEYYRKAHTRRLRNGQVISVAGRCVSQRANKEYGMGLFESIEQ